MKNRIPRSYLEINRGDLDIYSNDAILNADAIIIECIDLKYIFNNFEKYKSRFDLFKESNILIYAKLNTKNLNQSYKDIKQIDANYLSGFALPHASKSILNKMVVKARDFEHTHQLHFGTLNFIAYIDNPDAALNYRKIASYGRVFALYIDFENYAKNLDLRNDSKNYLREQVFIASVLAKKPLIDSYIADSNILEIDLEKGKEQGSCSKLTKDITQLEKINEFYTPTEIEVSAAREVYSKLLSAKSKERKKLRVDDLEVSEYKIIKSQIVLSRANDLQEELYMVVENESIRDASKIIKPKKFYTFGEEIANAISHGIGIILAIIFMVLLLIKGKNSGFIENLAYVVYCLSVLCLYLSSTLYHGLPTGSRAKNLFHKFDRMSIYLLISGTYTPLTLIAVGGNIGLTLFVILWVGSLIGILLNFLKFGKFKLLHMFLYVFLGWIAIFYIKTIFESLGNLPSMLILFGGIAYTIGVIFYSMKLFKFTHMIWHFFTIIGTVLHFIAILLS